MTALALQAVGEHLELVTQLLKEQAQLLKGSGGADHDLLTEELCGVLARSSSVLAQQSYGVVYPEYPPPTKCAAPLLGEYARGTADKQATEAQVLSTCTETDSAGEDNRRVSKGSPRSSAGANERDTSIFWQKHKRRGGCALLNKLESIVEHPATEALCSLLIFLNVISMILEAQYVGARIGHSLDVYKHYGSPAFLESTSAPTAELFEGVERAFAAIFTVELLLRMATMRLDFFRDGWMWLDLVVVSITDFTMFGNSFVVNITLVRALRLVRLLRIIKLARQIKTFDSLYLMTAALYGSGSVLLWVCVLLFIIQTLGALLLTNIMQSFYLDHVAADLTEKQKQDQQEIFRYFGSYWRAMVSLFELMLGNWPVICRLMMESLHECWSAFVLTYKLTMGFAVLGVIFGVFTQETFAAAGSDDQLMIRKKSHQSALHAKKMKMFFSKMTGGEDKEIDVNTFTAFLRDPDNKMWLKAMDYDTSDAALLFYMIDKDGDGTLSVDELIEGMAALKGGARNVDVKVLMRQSMLGKILVQSKHSTAAGVLAELDSMPPTPATTEGLSLLASPSSMPSNGKGKTSAPRVI